MPNPTPARRAVGSPYSYKVDPLVPSRDTMPCPHCGTTLSNCDWFPDAIGRLYPKCPNAHRHGTGWRAYPEPKPADAPAPEIRALVPCEWEGCEEEIPWLWTGTRPKWCAVHKESRALQSHKAYRERNKQQLRQVRAIRTRNRRAS